MVGNSMLLRFGRSFSLSYIVGMFSISEKVVGNVDRIFVIGI